MTSPGTSAATKPGLRDWLALASITMLCFLAAAAGGWVTATSVNTWYPGLVKPSWNPPSTVFGPVWTLLYLMMAVSAWLVWRRRKSAEIGTALGLFGLQLTLNAPGA